MVFLAGEVALKIKRDVRYDYMDLSTLDLREKMLRRELELNQPIAPKIYREVVAVTRETDGTLAFGGAGEPVEWVLRMWRFPAEAELAVIAETRGIDDALARDLGKGVFAYHARTPERFADGRMLISDILDELDRVFADMTGALGAARIGAFHHTSREALDDIADLLQDRADTGHVRRAHGDLHLRNVVLLDGRPVPFDALEFDEVLGTCDVLYDLAFLVMDVHHRGLARAANMLLNAYLLAAGGREDPGLAALPLFLGVRAAIRAMVAVQTESATHVAAGTEPVRFLDDAIACLTPPAPMLILIGGVSGTGKTTVARAIAPQIGAVPGAIHLRTDLERKAMRGVAETATLADADYTPEARRAVYKRLEDRAGTILAAGHSVILDATFLDPETRRAAMAVGTAAGVETRALWLDAPLDVLTARVAGRARDASDADESVVRRQLEAETAPRDWIEVSAEGPTDEVIAHTRNALGVPSG